MCVCVCAFVRTYMMCVFNASVCLSASPYVHQYVKRVCICARMHVRSKRIILLSTGPYINE